MRTNLFTLDLYAHHARPSRAYTYANRKVLIEIGPIHVRFILWPGVSE